MIATVAKWGNSLAVRIPAAFARETAIGDGVSVDISVVDGMIVMRPVNDPHAYDLNDLLAGITDDNRHGEVATGQAVGNEV
ncbi:AbrB/MazE/SpoVT family DNA-binding domain-containing protein [Mesorhizobium sp. J428]|uniref:AbrB/MazE/SpoVT family DNA-binding domain-containing protein n=1 Tax=Mesorhizobium sp. J428 TaxID=2898440 RepID=UPI0021516B47|nr:AbrB/MazE/SpoVT family DNA-binding domain-containing protein [Mesorhizobium sp. J428]MCR5858934.1 AbrB/MazE/SpoVT family DNA-binding domain-containing protein [Mesorhizobium sp. J428]